MSKEWKPAKQTVALDSGERQSRIRRDPQAAKPTTKAVTPHPEERDVWIVTIGVMVFAIAIAIIIIGFSDITSR